jgi:protein involved in polysaccharide export with SLBB domain
VRYIKDDNIDVRIYGSTMRVIMKVSSAGGFLLMACMLLLLTSAAVEAQRSETDVILEARQAELEEKKTGYGPTTEMQRSGYDIPKLEMAIDPDTYVLGPYDRLLVNLVGPESRTFPIVVLPEGDVFLPRMGALKADGKTLTEFRKILSAEVNKHFKKIKIFCYLQEPRVFRVFVTGEVNDWGAVNVTAVQRVSDAIEMAGSIKSEGSNRRVKLYRKSDTLEVDILKYVLKGDFSTNPFLSNGDRIHVPVGTMHVAVRGSVNKPYHYEILPGETVADLIDLAGGFSSEAVKDTILLTRVEDDGSVTTREIAMGEFGLELKDRDEINVIDGMTRTSRVYVFGATQQAGHYFITEGEGLRHLLGRVSVFDKDADLALAAIERSSGEIIRVDLREYLAGAGEDDIRLKDGDILHIPSVIRIVAVGGEVQVPGEVKYVSNWTVAQYIGAAGGPTRDGSIDRVILISEDGVSRKGDRNTSPNSGDVIIVKRSKMSIFGDIFSGMLGVGTLIISIVALSQASS